MATPFLSSEEYDDRAHDHYNDGDYDAAVETLKEGLRYYPSSAELYVGLGYAYLAREEFVWAKQVFEKALILDPEHEDALVGLGETLLRFGRHDAAVALFDRVRRSDADDVELLLAMGRALYRDRLYAEARDVFDEAVSIEPQSVEALASLGYALHRLGDETGARQRLAAALRLDPTHHEARLYLAHLLYDAEEWEAALREFETVPPPDHWDPLSVWRLLELKRAFLGIEPGDPVLRTWETRLEALDTEPDPIDRLLDELELNGCFEAPQLDLFTGDGRRHRVRTPDGTLLVGTWSDIVQQLRDMDGRPGESVTEFMRRRAEEERRRRGRPLPVDDPEAFIRAVASAGRLRIEG